MSLSLCRDSGYAISSLIYEYFLILLFCYFVVFVSVTIPADILNDVKSIVAQNSPRRSSVRSKDSDNFNHHRSPSPSPSPSDASTQSIKEDVKVNVKVTIKPDVNDVGKDRIKSDTVEIVECALCHQAFDTQQNLQIHLDTAHVFKCDLCSKSFQKSIDLKRHQRLHEGVKVFECKICYKTYRSPGSLHNHMRLHEYVLSYYLYSLYMFSLLFPQ